MIALATCLLTTIAALDTPEKPPTAGEIASRLESTRKVLADERATSRRTGNDRGSRRPPRSIARRRRARRSRPVANGRRRPSASSTTSTPPTRVTASKPPYRSRLPSMSGPTAAASSKGGGSPPGMIRERHAPSTGWTTRSDGWSGSIPSCPGPTRVVAQKRRDFAWRRRWPTGRSSTRTHRPPDEEG